MCTHWVGLNTRIEYRGAYQVVAFVRVACVTSHARRFLVQHVEHEFCSPRSMSHFRYTLRLAGTFRLAPSSAHTTLRAYTGSQAGSCSLLLARIQWSHKQLPTETEDRGQIGCIEMHSRKPCGARRTWTYSTSGNLARSSRLRDFDFRGQCAKPRPPCHLQNGRIYRKPVACARKHAQSTCCHMRIARDATSTQP